VPAAAVIPAPIAYIDVAAVKKLVVGFLAWRACPAGVTRSCVGLRLPSCGFDTKPPFARWVSLSRSFTLRKIECLKQASALNTLAWNNNLGLRFYFVGF